MAWVFSVSTVLVLLVLLHVYLVTRPVERPANYKVMVRVDVNGNIQPEHATKIIAWLRSQPAVDHVAAISAGSPILFTYFPAKGNADAIVDRMNTVFQLPAKRYLPTEAEMQSGCPVAGTTARKAISFLQNLF